MPLPADFNTVRVFGTFVDANGNPLPNSKVTSTATERLHSTAYTTAIIPSSIEAVLRLGRHRAHHRATAGVRRHALG